MAEITLLDLRIRRRFTIGVGVGLAAYTVFIVALYPAMRHTTGLDELTKGNNPIAALFGAVGSLTSPVGWMNANVFANVAPLLVLLVAVGYGAAAVGGQDEDGSLALLAVTGITRTSLLVGKIAALVVQAAFVAFAAGLATTAGRLFDLPIPYPRLAGATLGLVLLGVDLGLVALLVGILTGRRGNAVGVAGGLAVAMYVVSAMAPVVGWLRPWRVTSLFYWSVGGSQLAEGLSTRSCSVLGLVAAILATASVAAFERADLR
ncbi:MAG: hypothetical protein R2698_12685 [Microthrixaceae bacterium]